MNSETYLKKLRSVLLENSSEQQTNEILSDYRDFFQTGLTEGKTEAQLCAEFGPPEQAAQELLGSAEDGSEKSGTRKQRLLCVGLSVLALLVYATFTDIFLYLFGNSFVRFNFQSTGTENSAEAIYAGSIPWVAFLSAFLFPLALQAVLSRWLSFKGVRRETSSWMRILPAVLLAVSAVVLGCFCFCTTNFLEMYTRRTRDASQFLGPAVYAAQLAEFCLLLLLAAGVIQMGAAMRGDRRSRFFLFLTTGLISAITNVNNLLDYIPMFIEIPHAYRFVASAVLWGILPSLAAAGLFELFQKVFPKIRGHRKEAVWTDK